MSLHYLKHGTVQCLLLVVILSIGYRYYTESSPSVQIEEADPFQNVHQSSNLSLSIELTQQITKTITQTLEQESDPNDIDIWSLIFYSLCCGSSLFRRRIWEKEAVYLPLGHIGNNQTLHLMHSSLSTLSDIQKVYKLLEYEYLYESSSAFFINQVIRSSAYSQSQRIGPRRMKSGLKHSTLVLNKGGIIFPEVHNLEIAAMNVMGYPVNTNIYFSDSSHRGADHLSSRIHTDRQDAVIIQVSGSKRWRIWTPKIKMAHFRQQRGKDDDETFEPPKDLGVDWNETLIDVVLSAGDLLYIPRAFPHEVSMVESDDISVHLTMGIETETVGLTMDNLLLCVLGMNQKLKTKQQNLNELTSIIKDIVANDRFEHFRRSIPFGFNYNENGDGQRHQIWNRVKNLTNSLYEMKRKYDKKLRENRKEKKRQIEPSELLVERAYAVFEDLKDDLIRTYGNKVNVEGDNWNEQQDELQQMLIDKVTRSFKKCGIKVENTDMLFGIKIG